MLGTSACDSAPPQVQSDAATDVTNAVDAAYGGPPDTGADVPNAVDAADASRPDSGSPDTGVDRPDSTIALYGAPPFDAGEGTDAGRPDTSVQPPDGGFDFETGIVPAYGAPAVIDSGTPSE